MAQDPSAGNTPSLDYGDLLQSAAISPARWQSYPDDWKVGIAKTAMLAYQSGDREPDGDVVTVLALAWTQPACRVAILDLKSEYTPREQRVAFERLLIDRYETIRRSYPYLSEVDGDGYAPVVTGDGKTTKSKKAGKEKRKPGHELTWPEVEPLLFPVESGRLLDDMAALISRHVSLPPGAADVVAAWCVSTYLHSHPDLEISTFLRVTSPTKRCGKSTLLEVISELSWRPLPVSGITPAAVFRTVEQHEPTLLFDEIDTYLKDNPELLALLNGSQKRNEARVVRMVGEGRNLEARAFSSWCPKVLSGIGRLSGTTADRCITLRMQRRAGDPLPKWRTRDRGHLGRLKQRIARWATDNTDAVMLARDEVTLPAWLHDRACDAWEILFAIAHVVGGGWPDRILQACQSIQAAAEDLDETGYVEALAQDVLTVVNDGDYGPNISSRALVDALLNLEGAPWSEYGKMGLNQNSLGRMLKELGAPKAGTIRQSGSTSTARGYKTDVLRDVCARYAPQNYLNTPLTTDTATQANNDAAKRKSQPTQQERHVSVDNPVSASIYADCVAVSVETPPEREKEQDPVENPPCHHTRAVRIETPDSMREVWECPDCGKRRGPGRSRWQPPHDEALDLNDETPANVDSMATLARMNKARHGKVIQATAETARDMMGG